MNRFKLILQLPLLALDCFINMCFGASFKQTLSGEAWRQRNHPWWGWSHKFIDWMPWFGKGHCENTANAEQRHGSIWNSWLYLWKKS